MLLFRTCLVNSSIRLLFHLQRIDQEVYHMVVAQLQQHVVAKNSKTSLETSSADGKTLVPVSEMGRITCDMEFRFMLHRHWSLYEVSVLSCRWWVLSMRVGVKRWESARKLYGRSAVEYPPLACRWFSEELLRNLTWRAVLSCARARCAILLYLQFLTISYCPCVSPFCGEPGGNAEC